MRGRHDVDLELAKAQPRGQDGVARDGPGRRRRALTLTTTAAAAAAAAFDIQAPSLCCRCRRLCLCLLGRIAQLRAQMQVPVDVQLPQQGQVAHGASRRHRARLDLLHARDVAWWGSGHGMGRGAGSEIELRWEG